MGRGDKTDSPVTPCPCGCGIPVTTKKGIRYRDAESDRQLERHFRGMRERVNKSRRVVK